jgi:hypothetical protein
MALKKTTGGRQAKSKQVGLAAKPIARIQTAEGWRRSQLRSRKAAVKR